MKLRTLFLLLFTLICFNHINAQKVKLKKGIVLVDGKEKFKYERKGMGTEFSLYSIDTEKEILFILRNNNKNDGSFYQLIFIEENCKLETAKLSNHSFKYFIEKLIREKVMDLKGNIDLKILDTFFSKYDENITNRTIRVLKV